MCPGCGSLVGVRDDKAPTTAVGDPAAAGRPRERRPRDEGKAVEHLPVAVVPNLARFLADVKSNDLWAYAADAEGSVAMWEADLTGGVALVLGAEGKGVRPLVRKTCDATVAIPLGGEVASLNVSVAAAVLLFEARRQRGARSG